MSQHVFYDADGIIHLHTKYSDGSGDIPDIMKDAANQQLDFIIFTDHNTLKPLKDGWEGWYGSVLAIIGMEINDRNDENHLLAMGIDDLAAKNLTATEYVSEVVDRGGICFLAHPHEKRDQLPQYPPYPWKAWESRDFNGMEIWNHMSSWMEGLTEENKYQRFIHPLKSLTTPPAETLAKWDELNRDRLVVGIGGSDCHAFEQEILGVTVQVFPYKVAFRAIRTSVLLDSPLNQADSFATSEGKILQALKNGRCFFVNYYRGSGKGFRFWYEMSGSDLQMGDRQPFQPGVFKVFSPEIRTITLLKDGVEIARVSDTDHLTLPVTGPGVYRSVVWFNDTGWIYSNPITLL